MNLGPVASTLYPALQYATIAAAAAAIIAPGPTGACVACVLVCLCAWNNETEQRIAQCVC